MQLSTILSKAKGAIARLLSRINSYGVHVRALALICYWLWCN